MERVKVFLEHELEPGLVSRFTKGWWQWLAHHDGKYDRAEGRRNTRLKVRWSADCSYVRTGAQTHEDDRSGDYPPLP